jgi:hypothetical protein
MGDKLYKKNNSGWVGMVGGRLSYFFFTTLPIQLLAEPFHEQSRDPWDLLFRILERCSKVFNRMALGISEAEAMQLILFFVDQTRHVSKKTLFLGRCNVCSNVWRTYIVQHGPHKCLVDFISGEFPA